MNAKDIKLVMAKAVEESHNNIVKARDAELDEYISLTKKGSNYLSDEAIYKVRMLEKYETALLNSRRRRTAWPQFIEYLTMNVEKFFSEMNLCNIEFKPGESANYFDIVNWDTIVRVSYQKLRYDNQLVIKYHYSRDGGVTFTSKTLVIAETNPDNDDNVISPKEAVRRVVKYLERHMPKLNTLNSDESE